MRRPDVFGFTCLGLCQKWGLSLGLLLVCWTIVCQPLPAQEARYELGRRVKRFEQQWEQSEPQSRARTTAWMEKAVSSFFSLQLLEAGKSLDRATMALDNADPPDAKTAWVLSRRLDVTPLFADVQQTTVTLKLKEFYAVDEEANQASASLKLQGSIYPLAASGRYALHFDRTVSPIKQTEWLDVAMLEQGWDWSEIDLPEGDYAIAVMAKVGDQSMRLSETVISRVKMLDSRLKEAVAAAEALRKGSAPSTGIATLRSHISILENIRDGDVQETDFPAAKLLADVETLISTGGDASKILNDQFVGDTWISLAQGRRTANVRLRVPARKLESYPVLFLFHGAGGSENMFFETYGAGRAVELAAARGWIVVAPRQRLLGGIGLNCSEMLEELGRYFPVDRERVLFCGHSMGAMQATQQTVQAPDLPTAVAALGGGGRLSGRELGPAPWFIAAGDRDFGKGGAKALAEAVQGKGKSVRWKEYPMTEHMVIVQAALDDVFEFFDEVVKR